MTTAAMARADPHAGQPTAPSHSAAAPPPRKRRRRTGAGGATDDCFTCRKRGAQCDRNRPYCTQCIEIGKECSGYKTTLTWGVGVASRGKLRGLSCPIATEIANEHETSPTEDGRKRRKSSAAKSKKVETKPEHDGLSDAAWTQSGKVQPNDSSPTSFLPQQQPGAILPVPIPPVQQRWRMPEYQQHSISRSAARSRPHSISLPPLEHIHTNFRYDFTGPPSAVGSYAETEFYSPLEYPQTPASIYTSNPFAERQAPASDYGGPVDKYDAPLSAKADPSASGHPYQENVDLQSSQAAVTGLDQMLFDGGNISLDATNASDLDFQDDEAEHDQQSLAFPDMRFSSPFFHLSPRMQSLMDYYDQHICPILVAIDGPENPYRKHVLQLALNNEGLQNAIAALATNNMRMRQKQPQPIGFVEELTDAFASGDNSFNNASAEESLYKQLSIDHLNFQLADAQVAQDDSVLATLLILCLFHVCDSGFSKFKTQLAGVQKLLSLRRSGISSDFTGWVEMFFTWFDVLTSAVNDREMQIKGESLGLLDFSNNLGALEQFSGCDGRLFKLIARLGRLNLLAQGRAVRASNGRNGRSPGFNAFRRQAQKQRMANRSLSAEDYANIDGNGWGTPILSSDEDAECSADEGSTQSATGERHEFWQEWNDVRARLQKWHMSAPLSDASDSGAQTMNDPRQSHTGHRDLVHINESFRYSALLYTERLGSPCLPSAHPEFQKLVSQALHHLEAIPITSCVNKFLLWPLFMVGTECVDEGHRNSIRLRCLELTKESGFFNNMSTLDVLERVWREVGDNSKGHEEAEVTSRRRESEAGHRGRRYAQAFRWRKAMDRVDGEYIVI